MDGGFLAWPNEENIQIFNQSINSLDPNLDFTFEPSSWCSKMNMEKLRLIFTVS